MLRRLFLLSIILLSAFSNFAQDEMPNSVDEVIKWNFTVTHEGCEAIINMTAEQKDHWHVYTQKQPNGSVAYPTEFTFAESDDYELIGSVREYGAEEHDNDGFPEKYFPGDKAKFKQRIKINTDKPFTIKLEYGFMACKTACFPPEFREVDIKCDGKKGDCEAVEVDPEMADTSEVEVELIDSPIGFQAFSTFSSKTDYRLVVTPIINSGNFLLNGGFKVKFEGSFTADGKLNLPAFKDSSITKDSITFSVYDAGQIIQSIKIDRNDSAQTIKAMITYEGINDAGERFVSKETEIAIPLEEAFFSENSDGISGSSYWGIFFLAFGGGLLALLTPCVFPMIPMTVSFFTKGSEDKKKGLFRGVMYGLFIFLIYVLLSLPFHLLDNLDPSILNGIGTNGPLNIFFFLMLAVFAMSFLGAFEITMPSKLTNSADKKSNLGGLIGIFFMAITLALVSFSCTGPILGGLLASASSSGGGGAWNLTVGMAGFGIALGLPFALFAIFPGWLNRLPSSGGWLNQVKVVLGLLELALAFKFLSVADIYYDGHILERELFIAIWAGIFLIMAMYLFGIFRTSHDSPPGNGLGTFRIVVGMVAFIFGLYLIPGMFGAPVKLISAFAPPESYSEIPYGIHGHAPDLPEGASYEHGLVVFHDIADAERYAEETGKPIMIDFTGENCVNCRKMEANVWSADEVHALMSQDFVIASLYVDDAAKLDKPEISPYSGRELNTYGDKWADFQSKVFNKNSQPQYVILDKNGDMINSDASFQSHGSPDLFEKWLESGKEQFEKRGDIPVVFGKIEYITESKNFSVEGGEELKSDIELR
ncbi:MAG: cytochrome c biogenesis protein CcdA [Crocinitomicaceae bacterium]